MFSFIPTPYNWIAAAVLAFTLFATGGVIAGKVVSDRDQVKYQALQLADSKAQTANISASLAQLQGFIGKMNAADTNYNAQLATIKTQFVTISQELSNALRTPLPADCKPTADRLRVLTDAVSAANQGPAARK